MLTISKVTDPFINLAIEHRLLTHAKHAHQLLLWRNSACVVIGRNQNPWRECNLPLMKSLKIDLVRRNSGGGAVYHDLGNANYCCITPRSEFRKDVAAGMVTRALNQLDIPAVVNHRHDIVIGEDKVSGSAFKIVRDRAYHHGTMLIDSDLSKLKGVLHSDLSASIQGQGTPSYRSSVTRLRDHSFTVTYTDFIDAVATEFTKEFGSNEFTIYDNESVSADQELLLDAANLRVRMHYIRLGIGYTDKHPVLLLLPKYFFVMVERRVEYQEWHHCECLSRDLKLQLARQII